MASDAAAASAAAAHVDDSPGVFGFSRIPSIMEHG